MSGERLFLHQGFTLVEILISLAVFGVVMIAGSSFIIQTIQNANQAAIQNEVRQNASALLLDIVRQTRGSYCVYYFTDASDSNAVKLRVSDDPNGAQCNTGNRVEYRLDMSAGATYGVVKKRSIDFFGNTVDWSVASVLTSQTVAVLDCSSAGSACGLSSGCQAGLVVSAATNPATSGVPVSFSITAQQLPSQARSDFCARVKLADTITPRVK